MRCCRCFVYFWRRCLFTNWLDIDNHFLVNICIADNFAKFFEIDFASSVFVGEEDCLIDDLLQLSVFQVRTNHHFQHLEELTVADVPIIVNIVDSETIKKWDYNLDLFNRSWTLVLKTIKFIFCNVFCILWHSRNENNIRQNHHCASTIQGLHGEFEPGKA